MDAESLAKTKSQMHSFAMGEAMAQAARDYQNEMLTQKGPRREGVTRAALSSFVDDPEIRRLHEERLEELLRSRAEARDREEAERKAPVWGDVEEVDEKGFLEATTSTPRVVCHFAHPEFARCKVMKERLKELAHKHPRTRFIQVSAPDAPFFTSKLRIRTLPCVIAFVDGVVAGRIVGFEGVAKKGAKFDDVDVSLLEAELEAVGALPRRLARREEREPEPEIEAAKLSRLRKGGFQRTEEDEDSDFSD